MSGLTPRILIALRFRGNTAAARNPDVIVFGVIAFDHAAENREENWWIVIILPGLDDMNWSHTESQ